MNIANQLTKYLKDKDKTMHIEKRDQQCIYCGEKITEKNKPTVEHIDNNWKGDNPHICVNNIALCCGFCNRSKGSKTIENWLKTDSNTKKNIIIEHINKTKNVAFLALEREKKNKPCPCGWTKKT